ncbi:MAG TPA: polysaccharide biosynthesis/export family protein [Alphaproteobacteria bacterium]
MGLTACASPYPQAPAHLSTAQTSQHLEPGDQINVTVFAEPDLSGIFPVNSNGDVTLPLVQSIPVAGLNEQDAATAIAKKLQQDYVRDPKVSVALANPRAIFVLGEVQKPGSYNVIPGMTALQAIAQAGGYTYRADEGEIILTRYKTKKYTAGEETPLLPGDTIMVQERYF